MALMRLAQDTDIRTDTAKKGEVISTTTTTRRRNLSLTTHTHKNKSSKKKLTDP